ncbi:MAG: Flagellar hook-associated protein 1 [Syntrophorhabdus sp. PtaB.Bin047]|nr:MAG: Flagellar hook-associated protein 1 [Syntrophorhabdus sp. PtaB.Bin047]
MGITSILNIARNALFAQQTSLQVLSNNIANVNTKGYARQEAVLMEADAVMGDTGLLLGNGVRVEKVASYYDKYLEFSVAKQYTSMEEQKTYEKFFTRIESVLDETNSQLTSNITAFFNSWQSLSADPLSGVARADVALKATNLAQSIRNTYGELKTLQVETDNNVSSEVTEINNILASIAALNEKIYESSAGGSESASFASQRMMQLQKLSGKLDLQYFEDENGGLTVMTADGKLLVEKGISYELTAEKTGADNFYHVYWKGTSLYSIDITNSIGGGTLKSLVDLRDTQLVGFIDDINDLAESLMTEVNTVHATGYNPGGTTGVNFFENMTQDYAANIDLSDEIKTDVNYIAVTSSASNMSGNDIALAIANLGSADVTIGGTTTTYVTYTASIASTVGNLSQNAQNLSEYHQNLMEMVSNQRETVSGVSIDEEMSNLIKFQYAYQAAARLINTADTLMSALMEIGR